MGCPSEVEIGDNLVFSVCTHDPDTGVLTDADAVPAYRIYEDETAVPILTGNMAKLDDAGTTGFYTELIACTAGNGFENGKTYTIYITAAVGGDTGGICYGFKAYDYRLAYISQATVDVDLDSYQANFGMVVDSGPTNRYGVDFFKNGEPCESGITSPQIRVVKCADGTDLIAWTAMTEVDAFGRYKYDEAVNVIVPGALYKVWTRATIGGALRYWDWHVYRDA